MENVDVVVVGSSVAGLMTAAYLKQQLATLQIIVLGPSPEHEQRPYVGESLVEPAALFMEEIGLKDYLNCTQMTKHGLSFSHKIKPDDPLDRRYSVHSSPSAASYCLAALPSRCGSRFAGPRRGTRSTLGDGAHVRLRDRDGGHRPPRPGSGGQERRGLLLPLAD